MGHVKNVCETGTRNTSQALVHGILVDENLLCAQLHLSGVPPCDQRWTVAFPRERDR